jgi:hypothetical protein
MGSVDPQGVRDLAAAAGLGRVNAVTPMVGGANNRVFRVETTAGVVLLKSYFRHPDDPRDRLGTEFAFSRFAWDNGVRCIPRPIAADAGANLGLFEYVSGRPLNPGGVTDLAVDQAIEFFRTLNRAKSHAGLLPKASESCFSLDDHFATVTRRVERLRNIPIGNVVDGAAAAFVESELVPVWTRVLATARDTPLSLDKPLDTPNRCVSPSDFGYHNAILADDGQLRFIDFEYAGWDDPSKLICDFFCQPARPAPAHAFVRFAEAVAAEMPNPALHVARANLLLPVYRVKWVCIMLNEFQAVGGSRRAFSGTAAEQEVRKTNQLAKARAALAAVSLTTTRKVA